MGSFYGHALPGSLFIVAGLWWLVHVILDYATCLKKGRRQGSSSRSWRRIPSKRLWNIPFEPLLKLFGALVGICAELKAIDFQLVDKNNQFRKPDKFAHSSMYGFFAFSGLIEILNLYKITHFSLEAEYTMLALAFGVEGTLFAFHLHGRDMFDVRIHTLLYIVIYLAALVVLLEACLPKFRRELFIARTVLTLTQGSWFWEIAYTIYSSKRWIVTERGKIIDMTEKEIMFDTEMITVAIMWHLLAWAMLVLFCCVVVGCLYKRNRLPSCCASYDYDKKQSSRLLNGKFLNDFSDEEKILLERNPAGLNNNTSSELRSINNDEEASF